MARPDAHRGHRPVWSSAPPTPSALERIWSLIQSIDRYPFFSACNASPFQSPELKEESEVLITGQKKKFIHFPFDPVPIRKY